MPEGHSPRLRALALAFRCEMSLLASSMYDGWSHHLRAHCTGDFSKDTLCEVRFTNGDVCVVPFSWLQPAPPALPKMPLPVGHHPSEARFPFGVPRDVANRQRVDVQPFSEVMSGTWFGDCLGAALLGVCAVYVLL